MMNQYAWWKYLIIGIVIVLGIVYALPNLFGEDPAIQISPARATISLDQAFYERVLSKLEQEGNLRSLDRAHLKLSTQLLVEELANALGKSQEEALDQIEKIA